LAAPGPALTVSGLASRVAAPTLASRLTAALSVAALSGGRLRRDRLIPVAACRQAGCYQAEPGRRNGVCQELQCHAMPSVYDFPETTRNVSATPTGRVPETSEKSSDQLT